VKSPFSLRQTSGPASFAKSTPNISKFGAFFSKHFQRMSWPFCFISRVYRGGKRNFVRLQIFWPLPARKLARPIAGTAIMAINKNTA
jgi:hypothetical protein